VFHKDPILGAELGDKDVFWIEPGTLVFNIVFAWEGAVALASEAERGFIASHRFPTYRIDPEQADPRYVLFYLLSDAGRFLLEDDSPGAAGRNRTLDRNKLLKEWIRLPSLPEQKAIAVTLEKKLAAVSEVAALKERMVWAIQEKGYRLLTSARTPEATRKDSGVEWLGPIPSHWTMERGRFLFRQLQMLPEEGDGVVTAFRDGQVTLRENRRSDGFMVAVQELGYQRVRAGDLVLHGMDAFAGAIGVSESTGKCSPEYVVLEPRRPGLRNHYYAACLRWMALQGFVFAICPSVRERAPRFRFASFKDVLLPVPPLDEQDRIVEKLAAFNDAVRTLRCQLEALHECRQALIDESIGATGVV
jgi:type I restriction enzyme S subunit